MKTISLTVVAFTVLTLGFTAEESWLGKKVPRLVTSEGRTFENVTFSKIDPDAVTISHTGGIVRIPIETLLPEAQDALGYDPVAAKESREKFEAEKTAITAANKKRLRESVAKVNAQREREKLIKTGDFKPLKILQVVKEEGGFLVGKHSYSYPTRGPLGDFRGMEPARTSSAVYFLRGKTPKVLVDDEIIEAIYKETEETFEYESILGEGKTIRVLELVMIRE